LVKVFVQDIEIQQIRLCKISKKHCYTSFIRIFNRKTADMLARGWDKSKTAGRGACGGYGPFIEGVET
jgi:hypothetical protein